MWKFIKEAGDFEERIAFLKRNSKYWPEIIYKNFEGMSIYASTKVRIKRDNIWYVVHAVESVKAPIGSHLVESMLERLIISVHNIQNLYQLTGKHEDLDELQIEESERLSKDVWPLSSHVHQLT